MQIKFLLAVLSVCSSTAVAAPVAAPNSDGVQFNTTPQPPPFTGADYDRDERSMKPKPNPHGEHYHRDMSPKPNPHGEHYRRQDN
ncbi:hypothetical protein VHEMI06623 [[Torrubiella] hemipterigena]|uniref:Uncharacterized protein n=1 Tax=[Torrubiella] hemipterigena TaxID=1531966 RepID=A0A0A1TJJ5_9HYPO|nr:hypothetical protein VHEMI06623 [[Torrubiella] hemipterigena]